MDYKEWFRVGDGTRCDPSTIDDLCSRASIVCRALVSPKTADVQHYLEGAFRAFGMPRFILSDGGPPFGSTGLDAFRGSACGCCESASCRCRSIPGAPIRMVGTSGSTRL
jgi:putative transposase